MEFQRSKVVQTKEKDETLLRREKLELCVSHRIIITSVEYILPTSILAVTYRCSQMMLLQNCGAM